MRKVLTGFCALALLAGLAAGCTDSNKGAPVSERPGSTSPSASPPTTPPADSSSSSPSSTPTPGGSELPKSAPGAPASK